MRWVFGPIGFTASFVSCDETSVHISGQTTAERTGCIHISGVRGAAQAVYILDKVSAFYQSGTRPPVSTLASLVSLSPFLVQVYVL